MKRFLIKMDETALERERTERKGVSILMDKLALCCKDNKKERTLDSNSYQNWVNVERKHNGNGKRSRHDGDKQHPSVYKHLNVCWNKFVYCTYDERLEREDFDEKKDPTTTETTSL